MKIKEDRNDYKVDSSNPEIITYKGQHGPKNDYGNFTQKAKFLNFAKSSVTFICFYFATTSTRTLTYNTFECLSNAREDSCLFPSLSRA